MVVEKFIVAINDSLKSSTAASAKSAGIFNYELQPESVLRSVFKNSSTPVNALAANSTHIFAAQAQKAAVHVYSREKQNQESIIFFPTRIHCISVVGDAVLVLGTADGQLILWELSTGRQISTLPVHLQPISCLAATNSHIISGSEDASLHVWVVSHILSLSQSTPSRPSRSLPYHQAPITHIVIGHSRSNMNICVSTSKDNTVLVWNYHSGQLFRTFLLSNSPLCLILDPCDRGVFVGLNDGSVQLIEFAQSHSLEHPIYDSTLQTIPVKVSTPQWTAHGDTGPVLCINISYDGTCLLSGHASGHIYQWDIGRRCCSSEIANLAVPVTNLLMESPFPPNKRTKLRDVTKPKTWQHNYVMTTQFIGSLTSNFDHIVAVEGFPVDKIKDAVARLTSPSEPSLDENQQLRKENEDLWKIINEQREVQKKTWEKYTSIQARDTQKS